MSKQTPNEKRVNERICIYTTDQKESRYIAFERFDRIEVVCADEFAGDAFLNAMSELGYVVEIITCCDNVLKITFVTKEVLK